MAANQAGFNRQQKLLVVGGAIFAVFVSLVFATWVMGETLQSMQFSQQDQEIVNRLSGNAADPLQQSILRAHAIDAVSSMKQLATRQSVIIAAFAGAFALCAIGFALFLLGADGIVQLQTGQDKSGLKPWLLGTAPGLLCFVLAVVLVGMAVMQRSGVNLASVHFSKPGVGPLESSTPPSPIGTAPAGNAEAPKATEAAERRIAAQEAQKRAAEKSAAANLTAEKLIAEQSIAAKVAVEKVAADRLAAEKAAAKKLAADKAGDAKMAASRAAAKSAFDRGSVAKLSADRTAADRLAVERAAANRLVAQKAASNRLAAESAASRKLATDKVAGEAPLADKAGTDRVDVASLTAEKIAAAGAPAEVYKRALALRNVGETSQALALLRYASSTGHGPSSLLLAMIYRDGAPDVRANFRQAERYQALAEAQGAR